MHHREIQKKRSVIKYLTLSNLSLGPLNLVKNINRSDFKIPKDFEISSHIPHVAV